jgi:hypothetical protein
MKNGRGRRIWGARDLVPYTRMDPAGCSQPTENRVNVLL